MQVVLMAASLRGTFFVNMLVEVPLLGSQWGVYHNIPDGSLAFQSTALQEVVLI